MAAKRLNKELQGLLEKSSPAIKDIQYNESNLHLWKLLLLPSEPPYNKGAFRIQIEFPSEYPFKAPKVTFLTKVYHPNIDESGAICLELLKPDSWKPATKMEHVLDSVLALLATPNPADPLVAEVAELYQNDYKKFLKNAEEHIKKNAEKRPK